MYTQFLNFALNSRFSQLCLLPEASLCSPLIPIPGHPHCHLSAHRPQCPLSRCFVNAPQPISSWPSPSLKIYMLSGEKCPPGSLPGPGTKAGPSPHTLPGPLPFSGPGWSRFPRDLGQEGEQKPLCSPHSWQCPQKLGLGCPHPLWLGKGLMLRMASESCPKVALLGVTSQGHHSQDSCVRWGRWV